MAQGLRCPNCGHKHPLSELAGTPTFRCAGCGQVLKTPSAYRDHAAEDGAPRRTTAASAPSAYRRPASRVPPGSRRDLDDGGEATEALPTVGQRQPQPVRARPRPAPAPAPARNGTGPDAALPLAWPWRLLVWVIAVPLGLALAFYAARWTGLITGNNLFDVISGTGIGRYLRLFAVAPVAALVIATIAHFSLERLPDVLERRRAARRTPRDDDYGPPRRGGNPPQRAGRAAGRRPTS